MRAKIITLLIMMTMVLGDISIWFSVGGETVSAMGHCIEIGAELEPYNDSADDDCDSVVDDVDTPENGATPLSESLGMMLFATGFSGAGSGTEQDPYQIATAEQLDEIRNHLSAGTYFKLVADLDLSAYSTGEGWQPIGNESNPFRGNIDGNGFSIKNLTINRPSSFFVGLFGYARDSNMHNMKLEDIEIKGNYHVGGLVGQNEFGVNISNSYVSGRINGNRFVGGLVGNHNYGEINSSMSEVKVSGQENYGFGGLVGSNMEGNINNSRATETVSGYGSVGGLVGDNFQGNIRNSFATGKVTVNVNGEGTVGGLVGGHTNGVISDSFATGDVDGGSFRNIGGLVGYNHGGAIDRSYATGKVVGGEYIGGLIGHTVIGGTTTNSYATGDVQGTNYIGGLTGYIGDGKVSTSFATGHVQGQSNIGGLAGSIGLQVEISNSYATGDVDGTFMRVGGLVGSTYGEISNSYAIGKVLGTDYVGGLYGSKDSAASIASSYFDLNTTEQVNQDELGKSTDQMREQGTYTDWDFATVWGINQMRKNGYPYLREFHHFINYDGNGHDSGTVPFDSTDYAEGATVSVLGNTGNLSKTGYIFNGWNELQDGSGQAYVTGDDLMITEDVTLYAHWLSANARLNNLTLSSAILQEDFSSERTSYTSSVPNEVESITVTSTVEDPTATVQVNGVSVPSGSASSSIDLVAGVDNLINVTVTAEDGSTTETYTISIYRELRDSATLNVLQVDGVDIPGFAPNIFDYVLNVAHTTTAVTVTGRTEDPTAQIDGTGGHSLAVGDNLITVTVTAEDGVTTETYIIIITRAASSIATLDALTLSGVILDSPFDSGQLNYTAQVANSVSSTVVAATPTDATATIVSEDLGVKELIVGENRLTVTVIAADKSTLTYTILVTRSASSSGGGGGGSIPSAPVAGEKPSATDLLVERGRIIAREGGELLLNGVRLSIPAGAFHSDLSVSVERLNDSSLLPMTSDQQLLSAVYEIEKDQAGDFNQPLTITLPFNRVLNLSKDVSIGIYWLNEEIKTWVPLDNIIVDWENGTVSGTVTHFTKFAVLLVDEFKGENSVGRGGEFSDIKGHWAEKEIAQLIKQGVINGYPDQTFRPNQTITRAEFTSILVKALGLEYADGKVFTDTEGHWAQQAIATAHAQGIVNGYSETKFGTDDLITREQMASMIVKAFQLQHEKRLVTYTDEVEISTWATEVVETTLAHGIIIGYTDGTLKPQGNATRAEGATIIVRALNVGK